MMLMVVRAVAFAALVASSTPFALAEKKCESWKAAIAAADRDGFERIRGEQTSSSTFASEFLFDGYSYCQIGVTDGALLMCFMSLPDHEAAKAVYAAAVSEMHQCLSGWSPSALGKQTRGPKRVAGSRVVRLSSGTPLQALVTLQGPANKGSTSHVVSLAVGTMKDTPSS